MTQPQPGWYADPAADADLRWWDGARWTEDVLRQGLPGRSALPAPGAVRTTIGAAPLGTLFGERVLVLERGVPGAERAVTDALGRRLAGIAPVGRARPAALDRLLTLRWEVRDAAGTPQLLLTRPAALGRPRLLVERARTGAVGELVQDGPRTVRARSAAGQPVGQLTAHLGDVPVLDAAGAEVARVSRTRDTDVLTLQTALLDPLLTLVVAAALALDVVLPAEDA